MSQPQPQPSSSPGGQDQDPDDYKHWLAVWDSCKKKKSPEAIYAASEAFDRLYRVYTHNGEEKEKLQVDSDMFLLLGKSLQSQCNYARSYKVFDTGAKLCKQVKEEKILKEGKLLEKRAKVVEELLLKTLGEPSTKSSGTKSKKSQKKAPSSSQTPSDQPPPPYSTPSHQTRQEATSDQPPPPYSTPSHQTRQEATSDQPPPPYSTPESREDPAQSTFKPFEFSVQLNCSVDERLSNRVYKGSMTVYSYCVPCTLIDVGIAHIRVEELTRLRRLGGKDTCILSFNNIFKTDSTSFLVTDRVVPVHYFFEQQFKVFSKVGSSTSWWNYIEDDFRVIFRDVIHGLMSLYGSSLFCGALDENIFVTPDKRGRILPSLDPKIKGLKAVRDDIAQFVKLLKSVLRLKPDEENSQELPPELNRLLTFVQPDQASKASWIINHPFIWTPRERYNFVHELDTLKREGRIRSDELEKWLRQVHKLGNKANWGVLISEPAFKSVYDKGNFAEQSDSELVKAYNTYTDIIRYMVACFKHVNDEEHKMFREPNKRFTIEEIDSNLKSFFPSIYCDIFESLSLYQTSAASKWDSKIYKRLAECCCIKAVEEDPGIALHD